MKNKLLLTIALLIPTFGVSAKPVVLNDSQIISIVIAANQADIAIGHLVKSKSSDNEVNFFAQSMVTDHIINLESVAALITKLEITPQDSPASQDFIVHTMKNIANLQFLSRTDFDRKYISQEIIFHEKVVITLDSNLIPNAKNVELKQLLEKIRPAFVSHLNHAKRTQKYLNQQKY